MGFLGTLVVQANISHTADMSDVLGPLVNKREYGRRVRAARILAGFDSVKDAVDAIQTRTGLKVTARQLYAIERGEAPLLLDWYFAVSMAFEPPGGLRFWEPCFTPTLLELIHRRIRDRVSGDDI